MAEDPSSAPRLTATGPNFRQNAFPMTGEGSSSLSCLVAGLPWKPEQRPALCPEARRAVGQVTVRLPEGPAQPERGAALPSKDAGKAVNSSTASHQFSVLPSLGRQLWNPWG